MKTKQRDLKKSIDLLSLREAAIRLKVSTGTLRRWDNSGILKAVRVGIRRGKGDRRYRFEDMENYINKKKQTKLLKSVSKYIHLNKELDLYIAEPHWARKILKERKLL
jgi:excisionase family DNA binding protein